MKKIRLVISIILFSMLLPLLISCGDSSSQSTDETTQSSQTESQKNTEQKTESGSDETEQNTTEQQSDSESATEETEEEITDVMIGDTLEADYAADFSVAKIFSNDMVVQRNEHIRVWGFAPESENGKKVSGEFKGMFAEAIIENGEWCITFGARLEEDTAPAEMKIYTDKKEVVFSGVLVGDVYLVMGQSNAAHTVSTHITYSDAATQGGGKEAIDPNSIIRLNNLNNSGGTYKEKGSAYIYSDLENTKFWTRTTESDTLNFSAIGYYFARAMVEKSENKVPVGLVEVARGGAPLGSFLPNELADEFDSDYYNSITGKYYTTISAEHQGRYLYNCYLAPISKLAVAGAVWYQGESNNSQQNSMNYCKEFSAFIDHLRSTHNVINKEFPVFVVEFPSIFKAPAGHTGDWYFMELGIIRAYMGILPSVLENCYIGASSDVWSDKTFFNNLHPNCKYEQAARLADIAEAVIFGKGDLNTVAGPVFKDVAISEDKKTVTVTFSNIGEGLTTADGGDAVKGVVGIVNKDFVYTTVKPVSATITGKDQITVVFDTEVKAVAYNYDSQDLFGETINLCNSTKIPAVAFITPYSEKEIGEYTSDSFIKDTSSAAKRVAKSIDRLAADGEDLFPIGGIEVKLEQVGNKVSVPEGTGTISSYGWVSFKAEIFMFGYSIDGGNAVFKSYVVAPGDAVLAAGGKYAQRYNININISELSAGTHEISILALVNLKGGTAVKILTFTVEIIERKPAPDGINAPSILDAEYGLVDTAHDRLNVDETTVYLANVDSKLEAAGNRVTVNKGTKNISYAGWLGFATTIDRLGYAIDGNTPVINSTTVAAEPAVIERGGENAKRYLVTVDISGLEVGEHTIDILVRINLPNGGTAVLIINTITLIIK